MKNERKKNSNGSWRVSINKGCTLFPSLYYPHVIHCTTRTHTYHHCMASDPTVVLDHDGARVVYYPQFLTRDDADTLRAQLDREAPWHEERVHVYGTWHVAKRTVCAMGDEGTVYSYAKKQERASPYLKSVVSIRDRITDLTHQSYDYALLNRYADGADKIGFHADDEKDLQPGATIAAVSVGAPREFHLRCKTQKSGHCARITLEHGSLLLMMGRTQELYRHAIPARKSIKHQRISLTFRALRRNAAPLSKPFHASTP